MMKKFATILCILLTAMGFCSCGEEIEETIVLDKTSWEGKVTSSQADIETTIFYQLCFTSPTEGTELQHLIKKQSGRTIVNYNMYSPFTYEFDGRSGQIHYGTATIDNAGIVYHKHPLPDVNMAWSGDKKVLKPYTNMPCSQTAYSPIQVPELTVPDEYPIAQDASIFQSATQWTSSVLSTSATLILDPKGTSTYTFEGKILAEGTMELSGSTILIDGKALYIIYVDATTLCVTDFLGHIVVLKPSALN